jgi:hypothetical protein
VLVAPLALSLALTVSFARADAAMDAKAAAQTLFDDGRAAVEAGRFADACPKFAESERLDPGIGTLLWLADCYENTGQTASAWVTFKEAAAAAALTRDRREQIARARASVLDAKLSRLMIVVPPGARAKGLEIWRDGVPLGPPQWSVAVPGNPGVHTISARAPGRKEWATSVQLAPVPGTVQVTIPELEPERAATGEAPASADETSPGRGEGTTQRRIGLGIAGAGLVTIALGTYFSLSAKSAYDASNEDGHCVSNACDPTGKEDRSTAFRRATSATIAFALGGAAIAGGAVLYFTASRDVTVTTALSAGGGVVRLSTVW